MFPLIICAIFSIAKAADFSDLSAFQAALDRVRADHQIPGMAAAIVLDRELSSAAVSGFRKHGDESLIEIDDAFQIGSVAKPMTATLAYVLDQKKILPLRTRIIDVFPKLKKRMRREYRKVTIRMLLTHLAAFPYVPKREGADEFSSISKKLMRRRYEYVKAALRDRPEGKVGEHFVYSGGAIIVAAMMEKKTGKSWESLIKKYVFKPLGLASAGFGAMSKKYEVTGVWEHSWSSGNIVPVNPPKGYAKEPHAPAGRNVHASIGDLAKFMAAHFPYRGEALSILTRQSILDMQAKSWFYATSPGWFIRHDEWSDWKTVYHYGDNGKSIAVFVFSPKYEAGYVITANIAGGLAWEGVNELSAEIEAYLAERLPVDQDVPVMEIAQDSMCYGMTAQASNFYHEMPAYDAYKALDGNYETRWATDDGIHEAWLEVDLQTIQTVSTIIIKEEFAPRVSSYAILAKSDEESGYRKVAEGRGIGDELLLYPAPFEARYVRLEVYVPGNAGPTISEFQVFGERVQKIH